jgi:hypothetical protein
MPRHFVTRAAFAGVLAVLSTPAAAQDHRAQTAPPAAEVLDHAPVDARAAFEIGPGGEIRHRASGFSCPAVSFGVVLTGVGLGTLPGLQGAEPAYCEYADQEGPVARLTFSRDAPGAPVLDKDFCKGLAAALKLRMGPGVIPGISKVEGPLQPASLPVLPVRGQPVALWRCTHIREPMNVPTIVDDIAALRPPGGWTVRATHTPRPPPCCNSYRETMSFTFFILPILMVAESAGVPAGAMPSFPLEIIKLKPGPGRP